MATKKGLCGGAANFFRKEQLAEMPAIPTPAVNRHFESKDSTVVVKEATWTKPAVTGTESVLVAAAGEVTRLASGAIRIRRQQVMV